MYRTINDIAKRFESDSIQSIFYVTEMLRFTNKENNLNNIMSMTSNDRAKYKTSELLCFFQSDRNLQHQSYSFESDKIDDMEYVISVLKNQTKKDLIVNFIQPIRDEFERLS